MRGRGGGSYRGDLPAFLGFVVLQVIELWWHCGGGDGGGDDGDGGGDDGDDDDKTMLEETS